MVLGFAFYALQGAPSWNPTVLFNAYAQVLVGSVAEFLVCWAVIGSVSSLHARSHRGALRHGSGDREEDPL